jgi:SAM-dependent methyltransferase
MAVLDEEAATIQTYDTHAQAWADEHGDRRRNQPTIEKLKRLVPRGTILEIGAGGGSDAALLTAAGYGYFGTDASVGMIRAARRTHPEQTFEQVNVYDLRQLQRQFDGFWASAVLLHLPKARIDEALQSIAAAIKPGGAGFISIKDGDEEVFEQRQKAGRQEDRLFTYWRKDEFKQVLRRNGFEVTDYQYVPEDERTQWHWWLVRRIDNQPTKAADRATA